MAFTFVSFFVMVVAAVGYFSMQKVQSEYSYISDVILEKSQKTAELNDTGHEAHRLVFRAYMAYIGNSLTEVHRIHGRFEETAKMMDELDKEYRALPFMPGGKQFYTDIWDSWQVYKANVKTYFGMLENGLEGKANPAEIKNFVDEDLRKLRLTAKEKFDALFQYQTKFAKVKKEQATEAYNAATLLSVIFSVAGVTFAIGIGFYFSNSISKTITTIAGEISSSSTQTSSASHQLSSASTELSQGATESAASLEETVSSLEELSSMVKLNSEHAKEANSLSQKTLYSAETGEKEINKLISAMGEMSKSSKKIEEIINVIDDIAFQTNLLALNAAVEAARAGEQGKGFAVVADAVRSLAGRSAVAAKDINTLIKENVTKTEEGVQIADTSGASLKEILSSVKKVAELNSEISAASQEQANGIEQISKAMNHLDQAIQSNASSSEEVASSATEMSSQAETLTGLVLNMQTFITGREEKRMAMTQPKRKLMVVNDEEAIGRVEGF
ncbi:HAMP domain-containing methyl-accepting chemotaxis protein [Peredibacter starrii]